MNLVELLFVCAMFLIGGFLAAILYPRGGIWLAVPGFVFGVMLIPLAFRAYIHYRQWAYVGDKDMPNCLCGSDRYRYEQVGTEYHLLCQGCKTRYEKRRDRVFVFSGDSKHFYRRLVKYKGWINEV